MMFCVAARSAAVRVDRWPDGGYCLIGEAVGGSRMVPTGGRGGVRATEIRPHTFPSELWLDAGARL